VNPFELDIKIDVLGKEVDVKELMEIDDTNLSNEFAAQSTRFAYFAVLAAKARLEWMESIRERKQEEAAAFQAFKASDDLIPPGSRGVTDGYASQLVEVDENCVTLRISENKAEYRYRLMEALSSAFQMRGSMLQSIRANLQAEMEMIGMSVQEHPTGRSRAG
jgi:hypothetical protein